MNTPRTQTAPPPIAFVPFSASEGSKPSTDSYKVEASYGKGGAFRIVVIDVRGKTVVAYLESFTAPADKFPAFLAAAGKLVSAIKFPR